MSRKESSGYQQMTYGSNTLYMKKRMHYFENFQEYDLMKSHCVLEANDIIHQSSSQIHLQHQLALLISLLPVLVQLANIFERACEKHTIEKLVNLIVNLIKILR